MRSARRWQSMTFRSVGRSDETKISKLFNSSLRFCLWAMRGSKNRLSGGAECRRCSAVCNLQQAVSLQGRFQLDLAVGFQIGHRQSQFAGIFAEHSQGRFDWNWVGRQAEHLAAEGK